VPSILTCLQSANASCSVLELKKNCPPELIIYIVGSKADLHQHRQVTPDLARLSLHNWFPPPRPPTPPPPPPPSTLSYIRPRFTSFPGLRSPVAINSQPPTPVTSPTSPEAPAYLDLPSTRSSALQRRTSTQSRPTTAASLTRSNTTASTRTPQPSRFGSHFGHGPGWVDSNENSSNSIEEADEDEDDREWGLSKGMELFEVSAKDDMGMRYFHLRDLPIRELILILGIQNLFEHLISTIIVRKDIIERENELKKRDSIFLSSVSTPAWSAQASEEEAREKAQRSGSWSCC